MQRKHDKTIKAIWKIDYIAIFSWNLQLSNDIDVQQAICLNQFAISNKHEIFLLPIRFAMKKDCWTQKNKVYLNWTYRLIKIGEKFLHDETHVALNAVKNLKSRFLQNYPYSCATINTSTFGKTLLDEKYFSFT